MKKPIEIEGDPYSLEYQGNKLCTRDGKELTVADFLADVELIKAGQLPTSMTIGLQNTEYQRYQDEEKKKDLEKARGYNRKVEMEQARRYAEELQNKKRKQLAVYEKLEKELTRFEVEEEEDQMELSKLVEKIQGSADSMQAIEPYKSNEIKITDGNIFDDGVGPLMVQ